MGWRYEQFANKCPCQEFGIPHNTKTFGKILEGTLKFCFSSQDANALLSLTIFLEAGKYVVDE